MALSRPLARAVVLGALALVAGCGDDGETTTTSSGLALSSETTGDPGTSDPATTELSETTEAPTTSAPAADGVDAAVVEEACAGLTLTFVRPVDVEPPDDDSAMGDALELLVAEGTADLSADAATILDLIALDDDDEAAAAMTSEELDEFLQASYESIDRLYAWALDACEIEGVLWACATTTGAMEFEAVGEAISGEGEGESAPPTTEPGEATPEAVYDEAESDGEPVEISRTEDEVVVAWLDDEGHAVEVMTVVDEGGWRSDENERCDDPTDSTDNPTTFETVPNDGG